MKTTLTEGNLLPILLLVCVFSESHSAMPATLVRGFYYMSSKQTALLKLFLNQEVKQNW